MWRLRVWWLIIGVGWVYCRFMDKQCFWYLWIMIVINSMRCEVVSFVAAFNIGK